MEEPRKDTSYSKIGRERATTTVRVWDLIVRTFHWVVVSGVFLNYAVLDAGRTAHRYVGYVVAGVVTVRIIWGFVGGRYARFSSFVVSPGVFIPYVADVLRHRERRYVGHNPAGGWMIVALLGMLSLLCVTGWMQTLDIFWGTEWLQEMHEVIANCLVSVSTVHVLAALVESVRHRENLVFAMFTGRKRPAAGDDVDHEDVTRRR